MRTENEKAGGLAKYAAPPAAEEELAAIQEAIDDLESGDTGVLFEDFDRDFRTRYNLNHDKT